MTDFKARKKEKLKARNTKIVERFCEIKKETHLEYNEVLKKLEEEFLPLSVSYIGKIISGNDTIGTN